MLAHLEATARTAGAEVMIMETGTAQPEAMALYSAAGYQPVASFGHYRDEPMNRCYGRRLG
jgi:ribosomal protein S18 acetylase RimI-like enzyme